MKLITLARVFGALFFVFGILNSAAAQTFATPAAGETIIGKMAHITAANGQTLLAIAQKYDLGVNAIMAANPDIQVEAPLPAGMPINIPTAHILPPLKRDGIVINLPEMRMYYYVSNGIVKTYPIGIGRVGKTIPLTRTVVTRKIKDPVWIPPEDIIAFNKEQGITLPHVMAAGPDNPLGPYAIYLGLPTFLIHSTIFPESIGRRASFGCIRMHESDIKDFFPLVTAGTSVMIIDMPNKVGWQNNKLYLETHDALQEHKNEYYTSYISLIDAVAGITDSEPTFIDWQAVSDLAESHDGTPHEIGFKLRNA